MKTPTSDTPETAQPLPTGLAPKLFPSDGCPSWMLQAPNPLPGQMAQASPCPRGNFLPALRLVLVLTFLTGAAYPLTVTALARLFFAREAEGSLVTRDGRVVGSELLAQSFTNLTLFWPRPSAADYGTVPSGAGNQGPTSADLRKAIAARAAAFCLAHGLAPDAPVPAELLLASGSGLDPHISPAAARFQIERVAKARGFDAPQREQLARLVEQQIEAPQLGFLGEPRVNILKLNLALTSGPAGVQERP